MSSIARTGGVARTQADPYQGARIGFVRSVGTTRVPVVLGLDALARHVLRRAVRAFDA